MFVHSSDAWKLALALLLGGGIALSLLARAPRSSIPSGQLRRMVLSAVLLYLMAACAWLAHERSAAAGLCAAGTATATFSAWLSRGMRPDDPPSPPEEPFDPEPPTSPERRPDFDWDAFEQAFRSYAREQREPVGQR